MYLNTDPSDPEEKGGEWKIHFKNGMRNFEQYLKEDDNKEELENFQAVKDKVERYVRGNEQEFRRGVVIIATADEEVWFADRVQMRLKTEFYWQETPVLDQLQELQAKYPKSGIMLVQQKHIKIIDFYLNEIQDTAYYELDLDTSDWKEELGRRKGNSSPAGPGRTNLQQDNFTDRFEANQQRWYKKIAPKLDKRAKDHDWEKIFVVGEADSSKELESQMNKSADALIQKNMLDHEESKVLEEVFG